MAVIVTGIAIAPLHLRETAALVLIFLDGATVTGNDDALARRPSLSKHDSALNLYKSVLRARLRRDLPEGRIVRVGIGI